MTQAPICTKQLLRKFKIQWPIYHKRRKQKLLSRQISFIKTLKKQLLRGFKQKMYSARSCYVHVFKILQNTYCKKHIFGKVKYHQNKWQRDLFQLHLLNIKSSHQQMFPKISVLKNFANFTVKYLCWSHFLIKQQVLRTATLLKRDSNTGVFL